MRYKRRSRPKSVLRSAQRQHRNCIHICTCVSQCARKQGAAKRPEPWRWWRTRSIQGWRYCTLQARLADADQITKAPLGHFRALSDRAHEHSNTHTDQPKHAKELATLLLTKLLLQPPYCTIPVKSCGRAVRSGCQPHQRSRGVFYLEEMLTGDEPKHRDGRQR